MKKGSETTVNEMMNTLLSFSKDRKWIDNYTPGGLAKSVSIESGELLEHFQWKDKSVEDITNSPDEKLHISREIVDIFYYLFMLAHILDIDIVSSVEEKLAELAERYPPNKS